MTTHRTPELRSLALHGLIAEMVREDPALLTAACARLEWLSDKGVIHPVYEAAWRAELARPLQEQLERLTQDTQEMRDLRQNSPWSGLGLVEEEQRLEIIRTVRE